MLATFSAEYYAPKNGAVKFSIVNNKENIKIENENGECVKETHSKSENENGECVKETNSKTENENGECVKETHSKCILRQMYIS